MVAYESHRLWNCPSVPAAVLSCSNVRLVLRFHLGLNVPAAGRPGSLCLPPPRAVALPQLAPVSASGRLEPGPWEPFATPHCGFSWLCPLPCKASGAHLDLSAHCLTFSLVRPACHNRVSSRCNKPLHILENCGHNQLLLSPPAQPCAEIALEGRFLLFAYLTSEVAYVAVFLQSYKTCFT